MAKYEVKSGLRYTKDHEWLRIDGDEAVVGVTSYAVDQLGDITMVTLNVGEGDEVQAGAEFGTVESVKTLSDLFSPIDGKVVRINQELEDAPELVNEDCYGRAWMIAVSPSDLSSLDELMDHEQYEALLAKL